MESINLKMLKSVSGAVSRKSFEYIRKNIFIPEKYRNFFLGSPLYLTSCTSAKVQHSSKKAGWLNTVMYLSPSDRAFIPFYYHYLHSTPELFNRMQEALEQAASSHEEWKPFTFYNKRALVKFHEDFDRIISSKKYNPAFILPDTKNAVHPFSLCPFASPHCRALCLNSSGMTRMLTGSTALQKKLSSDLWNMYKAISPLKKGYTETDVYRYFYLLGKVNSYSGELTHIQDMRTRRTHLLWLSWIFEGVIQNTFNDIIYNEISVTVEECLKRGIKDIAFRINGTSDFPVHTLKLKNAKDRNGKSIAGKNLIEAIGDLGVVCYDYTKDYRKMLSWIGANNWKGVKQAQDKKITVRNGFPSNYHLVYSWSEVNGVHALDILKRGGNVTIVFKKSLKDKKGITPKSPMPENIHVAQLSKDPKYRSWIVDIIDGDFTDLRFSDPYRVGSLDGGYIIGLRAKGKAITEDFGPVQNKEIWKRFAVPVSVEKGSIIVRRNPEIEDNAIVLVDSDLYNDTSVKVDDFQIVPISAGT